MLEERFQYGIEFTNVFSIPENLSEEEPKMTDVPQKSLEELAQEEKELKTQWEKLKKESFCLQTTINAWQTTLKNKLNEFKQTEHKLDEIYNEIWSEREKFCTTADKFNTDYGILSDWWQTQMNFVTELENLEMKTSQDQKCQEEIAKLEIEIEEIKQEIQNLQKGKEIADIEVHHTPEGDPVRVGHTKDLDLLVERKTKPIEDEKDIEGELFSIVNVEKVRAANKKKNQRNVMFGTVKQILTK